MAVNALYFTTNFLNWVALYKQLYAHLFGPAFTGDDALQDERETSRPAGDGGCRPTSFHLLQHLQHSALVYTATTAQFISAT